MRRLADSAGVARGQSRAGHGASATASAYSGQVVNWDDAVAKGPDEMPERFAWDADPPVMPDENGNYPVPVPGVFKPYY